MLRVKTNLRFRFGSDRVSVNHGQPAPIDLELGLGSKKMTPYENSKNFSPAVEISVAGCAWSRLEMPRVVKVATCLNSKFAIFAFFQAKN